MHDWRKDPSHGGEEYYKKRKVELRDQEKQLYKALTRIRLTRMSDWYVSFWPSGG